ncbi:MAG: hypothetical protein WD431_10980 [Cyclobacteriaceae bacterium]
MKKISFDLTYEYLQEIRMAQAVMESDFTLCIQPWQEIRLQRLKDFFPSRYELIQPGDQITEISDILIAHRTVTPETRIGELSRPLILPHAMLAYCRKMWQEKRKYKYAFIGKITKARKIWMQSFLTSKVKGFMGLSGKVFIDYRIFAILSKVFTNFDRLLMTDSRRGREFPGKAWDDAYFRIQAQAEFIICPSGDVGCPWTYRFFEAMLCGAIPIVQSVSPCYEPFKFYTADQKPEEFIYDQQMVEHNFRQCEKHLTVPISELNKELTNLYTKKKTPENQKEA